MNTQPVIWGIAVTLFMGGIGFPIPENPVLLGGGYAIFKRFSPPIPSLCLWYLAILCGDVLLFAIAHRLFARPAMATLLRRYLGKKRIDRYQTAFSYWGGWILFLARFTFGVRAAAYIAAGAARYSWSRFLAVDGLSVALQVLLFVGIGYYAGERVAWARATGGKIGLLLAILALVTILVFGVSSAVMQKLSSMAVVKAKGRAGDQICGSSGPDS
jgi:membrane protein DedA with SNARE-associated domain